MKPTNFPERVVWYSIVGAYPIYFLGITYGVWPAIAWILLLYLCKKLWEQTDETPESEKIRIPGIVWLWVGGMFVELVALVIGHIDFDLGVTQTIKSSIGWARGWALMAIFPTIGCLKISPQLIYRAVCIVGLHTIILTPFLYLASLAEIDPILYTSPLQALGGGGEIFFRVRLYLGDRFVFFTPWAPAAGLVGNVYFFLALQEKNPRWRWCGLIGAFLMCFLSKSRMATLCLPLVFLGIWGLTKMTRPLFLVLLGVGSTLAGMLAPQLLSLASDYWYNFRSGRADSTRVREALQSIALHRWRNDAPIWGHGIVTEGPKLVERMPIGSHHTIFSLLYVKGIVGLIGFAVPMILTLIDLFVKAQRSELAKAGLSVALILSFYAFGENLESLAYVYWPGLVVMGQALQFREREPALRQEMT